MKEKIDEILAKAVVFNAILLFLVINITLICCVIGIIYTYCSDEKNLANSVFVIFACLMGGFSFNFISLCLYKTCLSEFLEE